MKESFQESQLIVKDPDAGKDLRWEEKGTTEDEMVGWHHWLNGHEFEQTAGDSEGQGSQAAVHGVAKSQTRLKWLSMHAHMLKFIYNKYMYRIYFIWRNFINDEWITCIVTIWKGFARNHLSQACNVLWGCLAFFPLWEVNIQIISNETLLLKFLNTLIVGPKICWCQSSNIKFHIL